MKYICFISHGKHEATEIICFTCRKTGLRVRLHNGNSRKKCLAAAAGMATGRHFVLDNFANGVVAEVG